MVSLEFDKLSWNSNIDNTQYDYDELSLLCVREKHILDIGHHKNKNLKIFFLKS